MSNLNSINVVVESHQDTQLSTGNVLPLLNEIRHAIENLLDNNTTTTIDLCSIPMGPGEEQQIENMLGVGEVTGQLWTLGTSDFYESIFPGVWLIVHYNSDKEIMGNLPKMLPFAFCETPANLFPLKTTWASATIFRPV